MSASGSASVRVKSNGITLPESGNTESSRFRFLSWSPENYAIKDFLNSFPLPRVVRLTNCDEAHLLKTLVLPSDVDITEPLLFYKKYRPTKILAKCLKPHKNGKWKETGPAIVIPDSFPGWFTLLNQDGKECAMTLTSMSQVAAVRVPAFLTKFDVPVYKLADSNESGSKSVYVRSTMRAGSVLRLLGVWADLGATPTPYQHTQQKSSSNFLGGSLGAFGGRLASRSLSLQNSQPQQFQYVQCLSLDNEVVFIPFSATGIFYPIAPRGGRNPQHIYPLSAIARIHRLPLRTKMVFGVPPPNVPDFAGTLQLERMDTEDVVLACTLMRDKPLLFEIDLDCDLYLSQMTSEDLFIQSTGYQLAIQFCQAEAENWRRQVRVYKFGTKTFKGGSIAGSFLMSMKEKNKSIRMRGTPSTPSKLSLLFRPSSAPFGSYKDPLRRTKSFNVEIQSVSISLTQDVEEEEETKKLSTLFNFMAGRRNKTKHPSIQQILSSRDQKEFASQCSINEANSLQKPPPELSQKNKAVHPLKITNLHAHSQSVPDVLSNNKNHISHSNNNESQARSSTPHVLSLRCKGNGTNSSSGCSSLGNLSYGNCSFGPTSLPFVQSSPERSKRCCSDVPYGTVVDEIAEEENIYSEIPDAFAMKLNLNPIHQMGLNFHQQMNHRRQHTFNISSLGKGAGGSDGAFSGTFSSSNPSNRDEDIYDAVF